MFHNFWHWSGKKLYGSQRKNPPCLSIYSPVHHRHTYLQPPYHLYTYILYVYIIIYIYIFIYTHVVYEFKVCLWYKTFRRNCFQGNLVSSATVVFISSNSSGVRRELGRPVCSNSIYPLAEKLIESVTLTR